MDVPMPAGSDARARGVPWKAWVEQRRRPVIIGAFAAAALLGILIGLLTAPSGDDSSATTNPEVAASQRAPALAPLPGGRTPDSALNLKVGGDLRPALQWAAADAALAAAGKTTLSAAYLAARSPSASAGSSNAQSGAAALTADDITIPEGHLYYGVVERRSVTTDEYWAAGNTQTTSTAVAVPGLEVWKRVGSGPWTVVATGAGACQKVPPSLVSRWGGAAKVCNATG
jgi:hypothetical protein